MQADADSYKPKYGTGSTEDKKEEEEKPVINEYTCSGRMDFGFRKKEKTKGLSADNIETIYLLDVSLVSTPEEEDLCDQYKAVFLTDQTEGIEVEGTDGGGVSGTATYKGGKFKADFGNGVVLNLSTEKQESQSSGSNSNSGSSSSSSGSSSSSSSSSSGSSSSSNKDYSPGSEWEDHDANKDGKISDDEYRDAVNDYMDDYYNEIGDGGNNLNAYDYNGDGEMGTNEIQDAVGDYMDSHGY